MAAETQFGLLGSLLVRQDTRLVPVSAGKQRVVLAALLLSAGRVLSVDELAEAVWGDGGGPPASARVTIQNHVKRLRQLLGDSRHDRIATRPDGYLMTVDPGEFDKARFEALILDAGQAAQSRSWQRTSAEAVTFSLQALTMHRELGNQHGQATTLDTLGYARHHLHDYDEAISCYQQALALCAELGDRDAHADTLTHLGDAQHDAGQIQAAADSWQRALRILDDMHQPGADLVRARLADAAARIVVPELPR